MEPCDAVRLRHLLDVARRYAARAGLSHEDAEDCAITFVETHLFCPPPSNVRCPEAYLRRAARKHALCYKRGLTRRLTHECTWPDAAGSDDPGVKFDPAAPAPGPEDAVLQQECRLQVFESIFDLDETRQEFWTQRNFRDESIESLARSAGKSPEAVRKILCRASKHIAASLLETGWTQADVRRCLPPPRKYDVCPPGSSFVE